MKNELKEIIQEKCRKFVKYNSFDFNGFENNVLEIFEEIKGNEYYDREYNYEIKNFMIKHWYMNMVDIMSYLNYQKS